MFWLSHHTADELHRCYRWGAVHLCARCLGVYPVLFSTVVLQFVGQAPLDSPADLPLVLALTVPATVDWAVGRFWPRVGSNPWRTATGVALGLALGRSLFVHLQRPFPAALVAQILLVTVVAVPVIFVAYRHSRRG